jgi:hypothetical protein
VQDNTTAVVQMTAACEIFGRHAGSGPAACKGVVYTITRGLDAPLSECRCLCHGRVRDLPDAWREQATATPPCDGDVVIEDDELDDLLELEGDRLLELDAESRLFGAEL